jgi:hypothetical protein
VARGAVAQVEVTQGRVAHGTMALQAPMFGVRFCLSRLYQCDQVVICMVYGICGQWPS